MIKDITIELQDRICDIFKRIADKLNSHQLKREMGDEMETTIKKHFTSRFPGSTHYSPDKVKANGDESVSINVPGVTRAYHDIDIYPKNATKLTIPIHQEAYGKKASDFDNLIHIRTKTGKDLLARKNVESGGLTFLYVLKDHVHQSQDESIMPSNAELAGNVMDRINKILDRYR